MFWLTGKLGRAWVGAWVDAWCGAWGMVVVMWGMMCWGRGDCICILPGLVRLDLWEEQLVDPPIH